MIVKDPAIQLGEAIIRGTSIRVDLLQGLYRAGKSIERICALYNLTDRQVKAAINYIEI